MSRGRVEGQGEPNYNKETKSKKIPSQTSNLGNKQPSQQQTHLAGCY